MASRLTKLMIPEAFIMWSMIQEIAADEIAEKLLRLEVLTSGWGTEAG